MGRCRAHALVRVHIDVSSADMHTGLHGIVIEPSH